MREIPDNKDMHRSFLLQHWDTLAGHAWTAYKKEGRGFMALQEAEILASFEAGSVCSVRYVSEDDLRRDRDLRAAVGRRLPDLLRTYDPDLAAVFMVLHGDGQISAYVLAGKRSPRAASEALQSAQN